MNSNQLPVAVIGAGPVGLAAAAHLSERGIPFVVFEVGDDVAASVREWGHVQLFSPWSYNIDPAARRLLESSGWIAPDPDVHPTSVAKEITTTAEMILIGSPPSGRRPSRGRVASTSTKRPPCSPTLRRSARTRRRSRPPRSCARTGTA